MKQTIENCVFDCDSLKILGYATLPWLESFILCRLAYIIIVIVVLNLMIAKCKIRDLSELSSLYFILKDLSGTKWLDLSKRIINLCMILQNYIVSVIW